MAAYGLFIALAVSVIVFIILFKMFKSIAPLALHGIMGLIVFWLCNTSGVLNIPIDWLTFLISALGGVVGVLVVIFLSAAGVPLK